MKTQLAHSFSLILLLSFMVACGKSEQSSGNKINQNQNSNGYANGLSTSGAQAKTNLLAWYNSSSQGNIPATNVYLARNVTTKTRTFSTSSGCNQQPISVFGINLGNINLCTNFSGNGSSTYDTQMVQMVTTGSKSANPKLVAALAPLITSGANGLTVANVTQAPSQQSSGSVFVVTYTNSAGKSVIQLIDTGFNSALNPVFSLDNIEGKENSLVQFQ